MKELDMIYFVKEFIGHTTDVRCKEDEYIITDTDGVEMTIKPYRLIYTDLKAKDYNKVKKLAELNKLKRKNYKLRQKEIEIELKSELLNRNARAKLINEYNDLTFKSVYTDAEKLEKALDFYLNAGIYEGYIIKSLVEKYYFAQIGINKFTIADINEFIHCLFKKNIIRGYSFDTIWIVFNAMALDEYSKLISFARNIWHKMDATEEERDNALDFLDKIKEPHPFIYNLYSIFTTMLEGIDINEFVKYYPITKNVDKSGFYKDYYSSVETIKNIKEEHGNILNEKSSKFMLSEVLFADNVLFDIACKMFDVIGYKTGVSSLDLLEKFLQEAHEEINNPKNKFRVIKGGSDISEQ